VNLVAIKSEQTFETFLKRQLVSDSIGIFQSESSLDLAFGKIHQAKAQVPSANKSKIENFSRTCSLLDLQWTLSVELTVESFE